MLVINRGDYYAKVNIKIFYFLKPVEEIKIYLGIISISSIVLKIWIKYIKKILKNGLKKS